MLVDTRHAADCPEESRIGANIFVSVVSDYFAELSTWRFNEKTRRNFRDISLQVNTIIL